MTLQLITNIRFEHQHTNVWFKKWIRTQPRWQQYPISDASPYGWNGFKYEALADAWEIFRTESRVVLSYIINIPTTKESDLDIEERNDFISTFVGNNTYHTEPFSDIFYPIIEDTNEVLEGNRSSNDIFTTEDVVGVVAVTFYWRDILKIFLKEKINGMHIVIENSCNQTFTYTWSGSEPIYLGSGDFHETGYEDFKMSFRFPEIGIHSGVELSSSGCQYTIHTYPSSKMFTNFEETQPM